MPVVYAAGPIHGLTYFESVDWRERLQGLLGDHIVVASPMRDKGHLQHLPHMPLSHDHPLNTPRGIMTRDHHDVQTCDAVLAYLLGARKPSLGTTMELAWAYAYRKPVVAVIEPAGNCHEHPMIVESFGFRASTLEEGARLLLSILTPKGLLRCR